MSTEPREPRTPFIWQCCELPPRSDDGQSLFGELAPPTGYMLHSWQVAPIGVLVICWVRLTMRSDLGSELALMLIDKTKAKPAG